MAGDNVVLSFFFNDWFQCRRFFNFDHFFGDGSLDRHSFGPHLSFNHWLADSFSFVAIARDGFVRRLLGAPLTELFDGNGLLSFHRFGTVLGFGDGFLSDNDSLSLLSLDNLFLTSFGFKRLLFDPTCFGYWFVDRPFNLDFFVSNPLAVRLVYDASNRQRDDSGQ